MKSLFSNLSLEKKRGGRLIIGPIRYLVSGFTDMVSVLCCDSDEDQITFISTLKCSSVSGKPAAEACLPLSRARRAAVSWRSRWTGPTASWSSTTSAIALPSSTPKTSCGRSERLAWTPAKGERRTGVPQPEISNPSSETPLTEELMYVFTSTISFYLCTTLDEYT